MKEDGPLFSIGCLIECSGFCLFCPSQDNGLLAFLEKGLINPKLALRRARPNGFYPQANGSPLQYSCLEKSHGQRSMVGYSPWVGYSLKESDTTE